MGESTEKKGDGVGGSGRWEADPNGPEHVFWKLFPRVFFFIFYAKASD